MNAASCSTGHARWWCCQLGAREHYAIPRALLARDALAGLITDAWVRPGTWYGALQKGLRARFHAGLGGFPVRAFNARLVAFEAAARARRLDGWRLILARNRWFQRNALRALQRSPASSHARPPILFSYSYAALDLLRWARARGWPTVLGQIDPGPPEERIVRELHASHAEYAGTWAPAPAIYWEQWREECRLADRILVNSAWSRAALIEEGTPSAKITIVPLAYDLASQEAAPRSYPPAFTAARPLRVLFLGLAILRKGIHDLIEAARLLDDAPVMIDVAGPHGALPEPLPEKIRFHGPVARGEVSARYGQADLFVLPTHSDGFAITQLEAMAHGLPVLATPRCGEVVEPDRSGWIVPAGQPQALAAVLREVVANPAALPALSAAARQRAGDFSLETLAARLAQLGQEVTEHR